MMMAVQGLLMALAGYLLVKGVLAWFGIPAELLGPARSLWLWMLCSAVGGYIFQNMGGILYAQNRIFWGGFGNILGAWIGLATFVFFLNRGAGVMAYAYSAALQKGCSCWVLWAGVRRGPDRFRLDLRNVSLARLRQLYGFSGALFLSQLANLVLVSGQTLIVTKMLGLNAAAGYNVSAKIILTVRGVLWQLFESFLPGWQRLYLKNQIRDLLRQWRLRFDLILSAALAACAVVIAVNRWFVGVWARPDLYQGLAFDLAASAFCLANVLELGFTFPQVFTMRMWRLSFLHLSAAGIAVGLGIVLTRYAGTAGVFWAGAIGYLTTITWYSIRQFRIILLRPGAGTLTRTPWKSVRSLAAFIIAVCAIAAVRSCSVETRLIVAGVIVTGILGLFFMDWKSSLLGLFSGRATPESAMDSPAFKAP